MLILAHAPTPTKKSLGLLDFVNRYCQFEDKQVGLLQQIKGQVYAAEEVDSKSSNIEENSATLRIEPSGNNPAFKVRLLVKYQTGLRETGTC